MSLSASNGFGMSSQFEQGLVVRILIGHHGRTLQQVDNSLPMSSR